MKKSELTDLIDNGIELKKVSVNTRLAESLRNIPKNTPQEKLVSRMALLAVAASLLVVLALNLYITSTSKTNETTLESYLDFKRMHI